MKAFILLFGLWICLAAGTLSCSKEGSSPEPPVVLSSEKEVTGVSFKMADNPQLIEDIQGTITADAINVKLPASLPLTNLVPTIEFKGKSINPANKTAQNFTSPVTYKITAEDGSVKNYSFTATARVFSDTVTMVRFKWTILKDSVTNVNYQFPTGGIPIPGVYIGNANDYIDFNIDGKVYLRENNNSANVPYQVLPNGRISLNDGFNYECGVQLLSNSKMTLFWELTTGGGGRYTRTLYLKK